MSVEDVSHYLLCVSAYVSEVGHALRSVGGERMGSMSGDSLLSTRKLWLLVVVRGNNVFTLS